MKIDLQQLDFFEAVEIPVSKETTYLFAKNAVKFLNIKTIDDIIYFFNKETGLFEEAEKFLLSKIEKAFDEKLSKHQVNEILARIKRLTFSERIEPTENFIPFGNGIYNLKKKELLPYSEDFFFLS